MAVKGGRHQAVRSRLVTTKICWSGVSWPQFRGSASSGRSPSWLRPLAIACREHRRHADERVVVPFAGAALEEIGLGGDVGGEDADGVSSELEAPGEWSPWARSAPGSWRAGWREPTSRDRGTPSESCPTQGGRLTARRGQLVAPHVGAERRAGMEDDQGQDDRLARDRRAAQAERALQARGRAAFLLSASSGTPGAGEVSAPHGSGLSWSRPRHGRVTTAPTDPCFRR